MTISSTSLSLPSLCLLQAHTPDKDAKEDQDDRITSVQPLAGDIGQGQLHPQLSLGIAEPGKPGPSLRIAQKTP